MMPNEKSKCMWNVIKSAIQIGSITNHKSCEYFLSNTFIYFSNYVAVYSFKILDEKVLNDKTCACDPDKWLIENFDSILNGIFNVLICKS